MKMMRATIQAPTHSIIHVKSIRTTIEYSLDVIIIYKVEPCNSRVTRDKSIHRKH